MDSMGLGQVEQTSGWVSSVPTASPLDSIVRAGPRAMRQMALDHAVQEFLDRLLQNSEVLEMAGQSDRLRGPHSRKSTRAKQSPLACGRALG